MEEEGTLAVDFEEITRLFNKIKPVAALAATPQEFIAIIQGVTEKLFLKYFEFPNSRLYKPSDLMDVIPHVMDCINSVMPSHLPFEARSINGKWGLYKKDDKAPKPKPN